MDEDDVEEITEDIFVLRKDLLFWVDDDQFTSDYEVTAHGAFKDFEPVDSDSDSNEESSTSDEGSASDRGVKRKCPCHSDSTESSSSDGSFAPKRRPGIYTAAFILSGGFDHIPSVSNGHRKLSPDNPFQREVDFYSSQLDRVNKFLGDTDAHPDIKAHWDRLVVFHPQPFPWYQGMLDFLEEKLQVTQFMVQVKGVAHGYLAELSKSHSDNLANAKVCLDAFEDSHHGEHEYAHAVAKALAEKPQGQNHLNNVSKEDVQRHRCATPSTDAHATSI